MGWGSVSVLGVRVCVLGVRVCVLGVSECCGSVNVWGLVNVLESVSVLGFGECVGGQ